MKYISLFSGIGGFDLAFWRAGMKCVGMAEIDKACQSVLHNHFPDVPIFDDVRKVGKKTHDKGSIDIICGGFPCQDLSVAGKRKGLVGERSGLWFEFARVIDELEPRWVVIENVPGLLSSDKGKDFAIILRWLAERGYGVCWRILDAQYFGVHQRRRRVFIVGSLGNGCAAEVLFESEGMSGDIETKRKSGKDVAYSIRSNPSHSGDKGDGGINTTMIATLSTSLGHHGWSVGDQDITNLQVSSTVETGINKRMKPEQVIPIVFDMAQITSKEERAYAVGGYVQRVGVRRLTPTECERLQGFPEIQKTIIIDVCLDHQKNSASAEIQNHKLQKHAGNVGRKHLKENAKYAEKNLSSSNQQINGHAQPNVLINCGERKVEILNQGKSCLSVNFAEDKKLFHPLTQNEDFALLLAGVNSILDQITLHGAEGLLQNVKAAKDGQIVVSLSGNEIMQLVNGAGKDLTINKKLLKSIISDPLNIKISDTTLTTLFYFVLDAISGYIPKEILKSNSFGIEINTSFGWTFGQSDSARYRQLGNAVAVSVVEWIGKRIIKIVK